MAHSVKASKQQALSSLKQWYEDLWYAWLPSRNLHATYGKTKKKKNSSQTFKKRGKIHSSTVIQENFKETDENYYTGGRKLRR